jgi:nucleotide-binding universal stress UspA family protein
MPTLRHVVAGTDFSESAERALELAIALAAATGVPLTLVHVCEPDAEDLDDRRLLQCGEALTQVVARHRDNGVAITGVLRTGAPWKKLDNVAAEVGAGLIVVGRWGMGRGSSAAIGSVADQLVRFANRPVLTVINHFDRLATEAHETSSHLGKDTTP